MQNDENQYQKIPIQTSKPHKILNYISLRYGIEEAIAYYFNFHFRIIFTFGK